MLPRSAGPVPPGAVFQAIPDGIGHMTMRKDNPIRTPLMRQKFSPAEDAQLLNLVNQFGKHNWKCVMMGMPGRTARQCRERFKYYLEPTLNKNHWTEAEDRILTMKYTELGRKWAQIAAFLPNRTPIDLKNRFHVLQRSLQKEDAVQQPAEEVAPKKDPAPPKLTPLPSIETFLSMIPDKNI